jgi:8-oxo-dGTP diphosphatase
MKNVKACVIILNKAGQILLQKRDEEPELGKWVLFGGGVESGETEIEAAKREIKEELGYEIKTLHYFKRYENNNIEQPIFVAETTIELNKLELHEGSAMKFFSPTSIPSMTDIGFNFQKILLDYLKEIDN